MDRNRLAPGDLSDARSDNDADAVGDEQHALKPSGRMPVSDRTTQRQAMIALTTAMVGPVALAMPYALGNAGWAGLLLFTFMGPVFCFTGLILVRSQATLREVNTYEQIVGGLLGRRAASIARFMLISEVFGVCATFVAYAVENMVKLQPVSRLMGGVGTMSEVQAAVWLTLLAVPTLWLRRADALSRLSWVSFIATLCLPLMFVCEVLFGDAPSDPDYQSVPLLLPRGMATAVGVSAVAYTAHAVVPSVSSAMRDPTEFPAAMKQATTLTWAFYSVAVVAGLLAFGLGVAQQASFNLSSKWQRDAASMALIVGPLGKFALFASPIAESIEENFPSIMEGSDGDGFFMPAKRGAVRTAILISAVVVSQLTPSVVELLSLLGSIFSVCICVVFPVLCHLKAQGETMSTFERVACYMFVAAGFASGFAKLSQELQGNE